MVANKNFAAKISLMKNLKFLLLIAFVAAFLPTTVAIPAPASGQTQERIVQQQHRRIFIIRHGQRPHEMDPGLSEIGRKQAQLVAERLKSDGFDGEIYASPYKRTVETAIPSARLMGKQIRLCPELQESTYKDGVPNTQGLTQKQLQEAYPSLVADVPVLPYPWVMSDNRGKVLKKNVEGGIKKILSETTKDVAIFTHGGQVETAADILTKGTKTNLNFKAWNCFMCVFLVNPDGTFEFIGATADFMPPEIITDNAGKGILGQKIPCVMPKEE